MSFADARIVYFVEEVLKETDEKGIYHTFLLDIGAINDINEVIAIPPDEVETHKFKHSGKDTKFPMPKAYFMTFNAAIRYVVAMCLEHNDDKMFNDKQFAIVLSSEDFQI
jgi:hypothetical protein